MDHCCTSLEGIHIHCAKDRTSPCLGSICAVSLLHKGHSAILLVLTAVLLMLTIFFVCTPERKILPAKAGGSKSHQNPGQYSSPEAELDALHLQIPEIEQELEILQALLEQKIARVEVLEEELLTRAAPPTHHDLKDGNGKGKARAVMRDYREEFDWSPQLRLQLKKVFDISSFRLVQEP